MFTPGSRWLRPQSRSLLDALLNLLPLWGSALRSSAEAALTKLFFGCFLDAVHSLFRDAVHVHRLHRRRPSFQRHEHPRLVVLRYE